MRRVPPMAAVVVAALLFLLPTAAHALPSHFDIGFQDPLEFQENDPSGAYDAIDAEHSRFVRLPVGWNSIAPSKPADPTDPNDPSYNWSGIDSRINSIQSRGMEPILVLYTVPGWAQPQPRLSPDITQYAHFVEAVARRYSGDAGQRPRIRYFQIWNEPNLKLFWDDTATKYRSLLNAAYPAIKSVHSDNVVIGGSTAPFDAPKSTYTYGPFPFMRTVLCMSGGSHPHPTCHSKAKFDVWAHHPYTSGGPNHHAASRNSASLGDLKRMHSLLLAAKRAGHVATPGTPGFWVTEFDWDTKPPDPGGVPVARHARWTAEAMYRMWEAGVSTMIWFKLRDDPKIGSWGGSFQGGIYYRTTSLYKNEKAKPVASVLRFPFVAVPEAGRISVWGRTPSSSSRRVTIQLRKGKRWIKTASVQAGSHGIFRLRLKGRHGKTMRAVVSGYAPSHPFTAVSTKDVPVNPFGGSIKGK